MYTKAKRTLAILLAALTACTACACGSTTDGDDYIDGQSAGKDVAQSAAADDIFTLNSNSSYSMNPLIATNTSNQIICNLVYENMVEVDNEYNLIPNVITEWSTSDGGLHWDFTVATNRVFHDGSAMTATDVAYSLQCAKNSERYKNRFSYVYGCSSTGSDTFSVTLNKKNMQFPMLLTVPIIKYGSYGEAYPSGTGPYTYAEDYKSLTAFSGYYAADSLPIDTIYLKEYTGIEETISAFEDSLLDVVMNDPTASTNLGYGSSNEIRGYNTTNMHYIGFNMNSSVFKYAGLRNMMNFAFDRNYLVDDLLLGYGVESVLPVSPVSSNYNAKLAAQYKYDLNSCQTALTNAGFRDYDGDGYLEMQSGEALTEIDIVFVVCSASSIKTNMAKKFAEDMATLGLKVTVKSLSWDAYKTALEQGNFDMFYGEVRLNADFDLSRVLATGGSLNYGAVSDSLLDDGIAAYLAADDEYRAAECEAMCTHIVNNAYIVTLCFEKHQMITHRGVSTGITVTENNPFYNITKWTISLKSSDAA